MTDAQFNGLRALSYQRCIPSTTTTVHGRRVNGPMLPGGLIHSGTATRLVKLGWAAYALSSFGVHCVEITMAGREALASRLNQATP